MIIRIKLPGLHNVLHAENLTPCKTIHVKCFLFFFSSYRIENILCKMSVSVITPVCSWCSSQTQYSETVQNLVLSYIVWTLGLKEKRSRKEFHLIKTIFDQPLPHLNMKAVYEVGIIISFFTEKTESLSD